MPTVPSWAPGTVFPECQLGKDTFPPSLWLLEASWGVKYKDQLPHTPNQRWKRTRTSMSTSPGDTVQKCSFCSLFFKTSLCDDLGLLAQGQNNILVGKGLTQIPEVSPPPGLFPQPYFHFSRSMPYPNVDLHAGFERSRAALHHTKHNLKHSHFVLTVETNLKTSMWM